MSGKPKTSSTLLSPPDISNHLTPSSSPESLKSPIPPYIPIKKNLSNRVATGFRSTGKKDIPQVVLAEINTVPHSTERFDPNITLPNLPCAIYRGFIANRNVENTGEDEIPENFERLVQRFTAQRFDGTDDIFSDEHAITLKDDESELFQSKLPCLEHRLGTFSSAPCKRTRIKPSPELYRSTIASPLSRVVPNTAPERNKDESSLSLSSMEIPICLESAVPSHSLASRRWDEAIRDTSCSVQSSTSQRMLGQRKPSLLSVAASSINQKLLPTKSTRSLSKKARLTQAAKHADFQLYRERALDGVRRLEQAAPIVKSGFHLQSLKSVSQNPLTDPKVLAPRSKCNYCLFVALLFLGIGLVSLASAFGWIFRGGKDGDGTSAGETFWVVCSVVAILVGAMWTGVMANREGKWCLCVKQQMGFGEIMDLERGRSQDMLYLGAGPRDERSTLGGGSLKENKSGEGRSREDRNMPRERKLGTWAMSGQSSVTTNNPIWQAMYPKSPSCSGAHAGDRASRIKSNIRKLDQDLDQNLDPDIGSQKLMPISLSHLPYDELSSARHWAEEDSDDAELADMTARRLNIIHGRKARDEDEDRFVVGDDSN